MTRNISRVNKFCMEGMYAIVTVILYLSFFISAMRSLDPTCRAAMNNLHLEMYDLYRPIFMKPVEVSYHYNIF